MKKTILISWLNFLLCIPLSAQILLPESKFSLPSFINETSGIEWSNDSVLVTHNDSGNEPVLYFINKKGETIHQYKLKNTHNTDWEDMASDRKEYLYISDLGNNLNNRTNLMIHRFSLKDSSEKTIHVKYSDQKLPMQESNRNFDSEGMVFMNDHLYTFTKTNSTPYNGVCKIYKMNILDSVQESSPMDSMKLGDEGYWKNSVTAADLSDDEKKLALLTYKYLYLFSDFKGDEFFKGKYMRFLLPEIQQREAIVFDSSENIWITDENSRLKNGGYLYFYNMQKINVGDFFYREPEVGIVSIKTKKTHDEGIRHLQINAQLSKEGEYLLEVLKNGKVIHSATKESKGKLKEEIKFLPDDTFTEIFSVRIYDGTRLIYANKFDPFK